MLDNMSPKEVEEVLEELIKLNIRDNSLIEVSGGITAENIVDYAKLGIDIISLGALTHSTCKIIQLSMSTPSPAISFGFLLEPHQLVFAVT